MSKRTKRRSVSLRPEKYVLAKQMAEDAGMSVSALFEQLVDKAAEARSIHLDRQRLDRMQAERQRHWAQKDKESEACCKRLEEEARTTFPNVGTVLYV